MIDALLTESQKELLNEVREFVKWVPRQLLLDMDSDKAARDRFLNQVNMEGIFSTRRLGILYGQTVHTNS